MSIMKIAHTLTAILSFGIYFICGVKHAGAQQMPYYSQFRSNSFHFNPAIAGTRRIIDLRTSYRMQWTGFNEAPRTMGVSLHSRLMNGTTGLGGTYLSDQTGPTKRTAFSAAYAYHAKFDDVELSAGLAWQRLSYLVNGSLLNPHTPADNLLQLGTVQKKSVNNFSAGVHFYNDRFHLGLSLLNLLEPTINFFQSTDVVENKMKLAPHLYGSVGYNWSGQPDWVWENTLLLLYAPVNPMSIDYNLRIHYKESLFGGLSVRLRDGFSLQMGATVAGDFQISYSYDLVISALRSFQSGSHEIMLIWTTNIGKDKKQKYDTSRFKKQKYGVML